VETMFAWELCKRRSLLCAADVFARRRPTRRVAQASAKEDPARQNADLQMDLPPATLPTSM